MTRKTKVEIFAVVIVAIIGFTIYIFGYAPIYLSDEEPINVTINIFSEIESEEIAIFNNFSWYISDSSVC